MVELDEDLLANARRLFNGANVHHLKTLIFCYEEAIRAQNDGQPYRGRFENSLRKFVAESGRHRFRVGDRVRVKSSPLFPEYHPQGTVIAVFPNTTAYWFTRYTLDLGHNLTSEYYETQLTAVTSEGENKRNMVASA